ncbi:hypothetical protein Tco_0364567 [Tanacetum coccineum]
MDTVASYSFASSLMLRFLQILPFMALSIKICASTASWKWKVCYQVCRSSMLRAFSLFLLAFAASEVFGADTEGDAGSVVEFMSAVRTRWREVLFQTFFMSLERFRLIKKFFKVMQRDDGIFISQDKYVTDILKKFDFVIIKTASTLIDTNKALLKDEEAEEVDVHLYRSMIGSLMCLTASRPNIMFVVCACARFQVTPKVSHLHAVKRIFRYLKGQPKLGLWYPRDSPFDLEAFSDSDYAGASLDRKSTTGGCQFLGKRLISWQCKKQIVVANSTTKAEYVAAANCYGQTQKPRKAKRTTEISQSSGPIPLVTDETVIKEWEDRMERAATTASSLEAEQDSGNINRTQSMATLNESFPQGTDSGTVGTEGPIPPKTVEQKLARKNELKAKNTLLLAIPDEHLLKFHGIKDAKTLWEAIKARFGGNKESKKMQKTIQKQQYKNFAASRSEGLDKTCDRSLPSAWNNIALIMRNKYDLDTLSMYDLYNNLKVYESEIKGQSSSSSSSNSQNVAFISSENTSSTNESVNTAHEVSVASSQGQASFSTYADDVMFSFFANQSNSLQLDNKDLEQIDTDDLEEIDLKWQVAMLNMRVKRFLKKTGKNLNFNGKEIIGFDKTKAEEGITNFALMAYTSQGLSSSSSSDSEVHTCSKDCLKSYETLQKHYDQQCEARNKSNLEIIGYQMGLESLEARIVIHEKNEAVYEEDIAFLKYDVQVKDISIKNLKNQLEEALKEKNDLKLKLEKFEESSKNLTKLINSQISAKDKVGLGYDSQMNESEVVHSVFNSRESDVDDSPVNDRFKIDDSVYKTKVSETIASKTSKDNLEKPKTVRPSAPIIEDWDTDSDNDSVFRPKSDQTKPKFTKIKFVKSDENVKSVNTKKNHNKQSSSILGKVKYLGI